MKFHATPLRGVMVIELQSHSDERGSFARVHCNREFKQQGLPTPFVQSNLSLTKQKGTLRGMHYQAAPSREAKLVRCIRGAIYDVVIDLRKGSATYLQHFAVQLDDSNRKSLFIPWGFAHGFVTLNDNVEVLYEMTDYYNPELGQGVRWNDPAFGIAWPVTDPRMNERDRSYPDFVDSMAWCVEELHADD